MSDSPANPENLETPSTPRVSEVNAQLSAWLDAAGFGDDAPSYTVQTIRKIGAFLENSGLLPRELVVQILADIDLAQGVTIVQLPASAFVKSDEFDGYWLTDTGLAADTLRSNPFPRRKKLFACLGVVPAIKAASKSVLTEHRREFLFSGMIPQVAPNNPFTTSSAGTQYLVVHLQQLREI